MNFKRYFKTDQQLVLQRQNDPSSATGRTELLIVSVVGVEGNQLIVNSPYGSEVVEHYAISPETVVEVTTDVMGMGARVSGRLEKKLSNKQFSIILNYDMSLFQRRVKERLDCDLGIRFSRGARTLPAMRAIWEKNLTVLYGPEAPLIFQGFRSCRVNISAGGIRFAMKPAANQGDLCLILVHLDDNKPPVCSIAEVVWSCMIGEDAATTGMRFINILKEDQDRIDAFIGRNKQ
ncbi:PilZ domain-containing protein [Pelovirga terrestris]|uniref:PilZ domain-containing protein n=1 Tax=Pelovirga terrestris TaxID=2771352 RepID=A0A8J6QWZ2_9BACT|nr:PilZ domain-containing protein [Pelovirga terrestris]MBD1399672.1 PilZ domain-containing protein [Pelovirga terrestris]